MLKSRERLKDSCQPTKIAGYFPKYQTPTASENQGDGSALVASPEARSTDPPPLYKGSPMTWEGDPQSETLRKLKISHSLQSRACS